MSTLSLRNPQDEKFGSGIAVSVVLHLVAAAALIGAALLAGLLHGPHWGEDASTVGAIQASMVSAIPLPPKAEPVKDSVLTSENTSVAPQPPPKEATQPPPKPTDIPIKAPTPRLAKPSPLEAPEPPKHPQPTPPTPKAAMGDTATQLPQSVTQTKNGTSTVTVENRTFGNRYAYYLQIVGRKVGQNYYTQEIDARSSQGKSVTLVFDIEADGSVANLRTETHSGSATLDTAAIQAIQRVDTFGPLPAGDHITIEYKFDYHQP